MLNKSFLINRIVNFLLKKEYKIFLSQGCFDIAAKNDFSILIKILTNIDGLAQEQALSLKAISYFISAYPFVISIKNNREFLSDDIVYSRFELPVITPKMLESIVEGEAYIISAKGRHTVEIDSFKLKERRKELSLSLEKFSSMLGMSKKALYEIENKKVNPTVKTLRNIERILKIELRLPYKFKAIKPTYLDAKDEFRKKISNELFRIGFDNSPVYSAPFEIVGKEKFSLITGLSKNTKKIKEEAGKVKELSSIFSSQCIFVAKKREEESVQGIPVFLESELQEIGTAKELNKLIKEKI